MLGRESILLKILTTLEFMHQAGCYGLGLLRDFAFSFPLQSEDLGQDGSAYSLNTMLPILFYFRPFKVVHTYTQVHIWLSFLLSSDMKQSSF